MQKTDISALKKSSFVILLVLAVTAVYYLPVDDLLDRFDLDTRLPVAATVSEDSRVLLPHKVSTKDTLDERKAIPAAQRENIKEAEERPLHSGSVFIFGRVYSEDGSPIADALVSEESNSAIRGPMVGATTRLS